MSRREFLSWLEFHRRNPIDPVSLFQRPAALVSYTTAVNAPGERRQPPRLQNYLDILAPTPPEDEADNWFDSL